MTGQLRMTNWAWVQHWWVAAIAGALVAGLFAPVTANAGERLGLEHYRDCVATAATAFEISPRVVEVIIETEGGWPGARIRNKDGSFDLGVMQLNTRWVSYFAERGLSESDLQNDACRNIYAGTYLLKLHLNKTGDLGLAMAYYHNQKPHFGAAYLSRVHTVIDRRIRREAHRGAVVSK